MFIFPNMFMILSVMNDWPYYSRTMKFVIIGIPILVILLLSYLMSGKEKFIGTDMWYGQSQSDSNLVDKQERTDNLVKISKGYLPGKRAPGATNIIENFENTNLPFDPKSYEVASDYHRTVQLMGVDPNPVESLETPEFMIPKTYETEFKYENLMEVNDNNKDSLKLRSVESTFKNIEKQKFYKELFNSRCRSGNRSNHKNCGCKAPYYGEH